MKNIEQGQQQKITRLLKRINIITIIFVITSCIYIYFNFRHLIITAYWQWAQILVPFVASCIAFFNSTVAILVIVFLRKNHTRIATLKDDKELPLISYSASFWAVLIIFSTTTDFIFRINPEIRSTQKDRETKEVVLENIEQDNLQGFLQSNWRCHRNELMQELYKEIKDLEKVDEIITITTQDKFINTNCLKDLLTEQLITQAIDFNAQKIYNWQLHQFYELQDLKQRKKEYFRSWRCSEKDINSSSISHYKINECNTVLKHSLAKNDSYYLDLLIEIASATDQANYLQFTLLTNNEILFDQLTNKNKSIPVNPTSLAIVARYSDDKIYNKVIQYSWEQDEINQALLIAINESESTTPFFDRGIKRLVAMGAKEIQSDDRKNKLLAKAPTDISAESLQLLIKIGVDLNGQDLRGDTLLTRKSKIGDAEIASIKILLENGADIHLANNIGETPFSVIPPYNRDHSLIELMLKYGANINDTDLSGATLLMRTIKRSSNIDCTESMQNNIHFLRKKGAHINIKNKYQKSIFEYGDYRCIETLVSEGADINARDSNGRTPLINCIYNKYCDPNTITDLVDNGADVNLKDNEGKQAVHYATSEEVLNSLIINGADIKALDGLLEITEQKLQELKNEKKSQYSERKIKQVTEFKKHILRQISEKSHR